MFAKHLLKSSAMNLNLFIFIFEKKTYCCIRDLNHYHREKREKNSFSENRGNNAMKEYDERYDSPEVKREFI